MTCPNCRKEMIYDVEHGHHGAYPFARLIKRCLDKVCGHKERA